MSLSDSLLRMAATFARSLIRSLSTSSRSDTASPTRPTQPSRNHTRRPAHTNPQSTQQQSHPSSSRQPRGARASTQGASPDIGPTPSTQATRAIHEVPKASALASARHSPARDGQADPGEVVWTWIPYEEDNTKGKDRPVVVIGRHGDGVYVVQMTSKDHDRDAAQEARWGRYWHDIGAGAWDPHRRPSEVRLDRILWVPSEEIRREGAALPRQIFDEIIEAIRLCPAK